MYCKICGAALNQGDVFCKNCGASTNMQTNPQPTVPVPPIEPEPIKPVVAPQPTFVAQQPTNSVSPVAPIPPLEPQPTFVAPQVPNYENVQTNNMVPPIEPQQQPQFNPQPTFVEPPAPVKPEAKSGKGLMIVGIVVGILALAVIVYLVIDSGILSRNNDKPSGGDITVVKENSYKVNFGGYQFTIAADDSATTSTTDLTIKSTDYEVHITKEDGDYNKLETDNLKTFLVNNGATVEKVEKTTCAGVSCIKVNLIIQGYKGNYIFMPADSSSVWTIVVLIPTGASYPADADINKIVTMVKDAKKSTTSNIQVGEFTNIDLTNIFITEPEQPETQPTGN